jgi:hypothetical protein
MPIVFQSPDPVMPGASAGAGFAETWSKLFPAIASLYGHSMSNQAQAQMQNAQQTQNAQQFDIAQRNQAQGQSQALQAQADQTQYQATQQSELQNQKAQNEAWLNQQDLNQADQMAMTKNRNYISWLNSDQAKSMLPAQQLQDEMTQATKVANGYDMRKDAAQARLEDAQKRKLMDQHASVVSANQQAAEFVAKNVQSGLATVTNPDTGEVTQFLPKINAQGELEWKQISKEKSQKDTDSAKQSQLADARYKLELQHRDTDKRRWDDAHMKVTKEIEAQAGTMDKETGKPVYPNLHANPRTNGAGEPGEGPGTRTVKEWNYGDQMNKMGYGEDPEAYLAREAQKRAAMRGETPKQGGNVASPGRSPSAMADAEPPQSGQVQNQGAAGQQPQPQPQPFKFDQENKTFDQTRLTDLFKKLDEGIAATGLHISDPKVHLQARVAEGQMKDLIQKYGSVEAIRSKSPDDYALWERADNLIRNVMNMGNEKKPTNSWLPETAWK